MSKFTKVYKKWHAENNGKYDSARVYHKALMCNFIDWQPPKPLVVVPQFVADWFESAKGNLEFEIWQYISDWRENEQNDFWFWFSEDRNKPTETLIRMKLEGYTVKKEQLYEVVFSKCEDGDRYLLFANIEFFIDIESMNDGYYRQQFTEAEIKAIDERYWPFVVPVEGVEP